MARRVLIVLGTRPEAIKMAPVLDALRPGPLSAHVVVSGQHPDLLPPVLERLGIVPDSVLCSPPASSSLGATTGQLVLGLGGVLAGVAADAVVVHGDTTTALAGALAASWRGVPVAHVEAGLRTGDPSSPFPEELNRATIDQLATWWMAPTSAARRNLLAEGAAPERVFVTGNPVVDAVLAVGSGQPDPWPLPADAPFVLATCHRREHHGAPLARIVAALAELSQRMPVVLPAHPHPEVLRAVRSLRALPGAYVVEPLGYGSFVWAMQRASLIITDSGGVQEEAATLGRPTVVIRASTERPEVLRTGVVALVGTQTADIVALASRWLAEPPLPTGYLPFGAGGAGRRIAGRLEEALCG